MVCSVFSGAFLIPLGGTTTNPAPVLALLAIFLYSLNHGITVNKYIFFIFAAVLAHGAFSVLLGLTTVSLFVKTYVVAFLLFWGFSAALNVSSDYVMLLRAYLAGASIVAAIGMVQAATWLIGFSPLYDYSWIPGWRLAPGGLLGIRLNSILYEPSQVAFTMGPAACLSLYRLTGRLKNLLSKSSAALILALAILSVSSTVIVVLGLFLCILILSKRALIFRYSFVLVLPILALTQTTFFESTVTKARGLRDAFFNTGETGNIDASTFTLFFHAQTAIDNFVQSHFLGGGVGSHELLSDSILTRVTFDHNVYNANSAGNLTFRLMSEFGLFGMAAMAALVVYFVRGAFRLSGDELVYHAAMAAGIMGFFFRNGTYAHYGLALFVLLLLSVGRPRAFNKTVVVRNQDAERSETSAFRQAIK